MDAAEADPQPASVIEAKTEASSKTVGNLRTGRIRLWIKVDSFYLIETAALMGSGRALVRGMAPL
jgi:hypothetical protein